MIIKRVRISVLMALVIISMILTGCSGSGGSTTTSSTTNTGTVGSQSASSAYVKKDIKWETLSLAEKVKCYKDEFGIDVPSKNINFDEMKKICKDIYAWLYIPEIHIDTPVVQHPNDDEYYLNYNLDGTKGYPGGIYTEPSYNKKDFSDRHTVIYGRCMKNGTQFAPLHDLEYKSTFDSTRYIYVYTEDDVLVYYIVAAREVTEQHLLARKPFDDETWLFFLKSLLDNTDISGNNRNNYVEKYDFSKDDKLLTLCTALKNNDYNYRYDVFGILIR